MWRPWTTILQGVLWTWQDKRLIRQKPLFIAVHLYRAVVSWWVGYRHRRQNTSLLLMFQLAEWPLAKCSICDTHFCKDPWMKNAVYFFKYWRALACRFALQAIPFSEFCTVELITCKNIKYFWFFCVFLLLLAFLSSYKLSKNILRVYLILEVIP